MTDMPIFNLGISDDYDYMDEQLCDLIYQSYIRITDTQ